MAQVWGSLQGGSWQNARPGKAEEGKKGGVHTPTTGSNHQISLAHITNHQQKKEYSYHQNINVLRECRQRFSRGTLVM